MRTNPKNKKNKSIAPRKLNNSADAIDIKVPSMMTNPVNVMITVAMANIMKIMNGKANDKKHRDMPKARKG